MPSTTFFAQRWWRYNKTQLASQFQDFTKVADCGNAANKLQCLRNQKYEILQNANINQISIAPYGNFQYGPAIDGDFVQDLPGRELMNGRFAKNLNLMIGHNLFTTSELNLIWSDEGYLFVNSSIHGNKEFMQWLHLTFPYGNTAFYETVEFYYPPPELSHGRYKDTFYRIDDLISGVLNIP